MAEHRKVPFVTVSACTAALCPQSEPRKRRPEADNEPSGSREPGSGAPEVAGSGRTVRLNLSLSEPTELCSPEFSYLDLIQGKKNPDGVSAALDTFGHEEREKREAENLAKKFESKYGTGNSKKRKDRVQDLIDIGVGYDESDSFIDNSEAYDELVPSSLTTKFGGFYINTGSLEFRNASESDSDDADRTRDEDDSQLRRKKRRRDEADLEETKMRNNQLTKPGISGSKRKKLKDSLCLAAVLHRFTLDRSELGKTEPTDLSSDPAVMSLLASASESELRELLSDLDFSALDAVPQQQNGAGLMSPPPLPEGLPAPLLKRIEDLRVASKQFDEEGRKKFFTMDMNNILLDIELQVQEQAPSVRAAVYSHLEAFVPCNKESLMKRLKKLSLNIQDDRLRAPLLKLKLAVCSVMPEQTARYNMDCMAKVAAKQQMENGERNGSEDEEEERPGRRVMGPRKKFLWDDRLRTLLCNLVRVKLKCYEQEQSALSVEDYLKAFMETEVKPLWPKGWMQTRMLFKESHTVHGHLTHLGKKRMVSTPRAAKIKELAWTQGMPVSSTPFSSRPPLTPPSEPICLSDSLDEDLATNSLDSIAQALSLLNNSANGVSPNPAPSTSCSAPPAAKPLPHTSSSTPSLSPLSSITKNGVSLQRQATPLSRPAVSNVNTPPIKYRPLPTATPLQKPFTAKSGQATPPLGPAKSLTGGSCNGAGLKTVPTSLSSTPPPSHVMPCPQDKAPPTIHHQQGFITPMHATITKSSQSSNAPIIKLTPRPPTQTTPSALSASPKHSTHRPPAQTTLSAFKASPPNSAHRLPTQTTSPSLPVNRPLASTPPPLGHAHRSPAPAPPSVSTLPSPVTNRPPAPTSSTHRPPVPSIPPGPAHRSPATTPPSVPAPSSSPSLPQPRLQILTPPLPKSPGFRAPFNPAPVPTAHGSNFKDCRPSASNQRPRPTGGASHSAKPSTNRATAVGLPDPALLNQVSSLPLGLGVFGGLVPVSLPFQFPLLNFIPPTGSSHPSSSGYTLTQNLLKSLQSGVQPAVPPHLQLTYSDSNQSQGEDMKRK